MARKNGSVSKATAGEVAAYSGLYPLSHWVVVDGQRCAVEFCGIAPYRDDPRYEVMLPKGSHAAYEWLHTLLCYNLRDVRELCEGIKLVPCDEDCE